MIASLVALAWIVGLPLAWVTAIEITHALSHRKDQDR